MHLGERLRKERRNRHLSQAMLAEALGVSVLSISRWERGKAVPQAFYRLQLSRFFAIPPNELFEELGSQEQQLSPPSLLWHVPYPRNPFFTGREEVLQQIYTTLHTAHAAGITPPLALTGLAGIGKTQTALEYSYRYAHEYEAVFWVKAESYATLVFDLVTIASILQLPHTQEQDDLRIVEAVKQWLRVHRRWLLVLDNVEDPALLRQIGVSRANGHLLLTTRSQLTGAQAHSIDLQALPDEEGCLFLLQRARLLPVDQSLEAVPEEVLQEGRHLCHDLENFPLALDQAGAYIEEAGCSLSEYLQRYEHHHLQLLARRGVMGADHPLSAAATLLLAYQQVESLHPLASQVLLFCTFLYPDDIPEEIIKVALPYLDDSGPSADTSYTLDKVFLFLRSFSLIYRQVGTQSFRIHHVVQVVLRESIGQIAFQQWMERTIRVVNATFPEDAQTYGPIYDRYIPHVQTCHYLTEQAIRPIPEAARLFEKAGRYLLKRGRSIEAQQFLAHASTLQKILGL